MELQQNKVNESRPCPFCGSATQAGMVMGSKYALKWQPAEQNLFLGYLSTGHAIGNRPSLFRMPQLRPRDRPMANGYRCPTCRKIVLDEGDTKYMPSRDQWKLIIIAVLSAVFAVLIGAAGFYLWVLLTITDTATVGSAFIYIAVTFSGILGIVALTVGGRAFRSLSQCQDKRTNANKSETPR